MIVKAYEFVIMIVRAEQDRQHDRERVFKVRYADKTVNLLSKFKKFKNTNKLLSF